jgi:mono/diheme cytochrome c family protein
MRIPAGCAAGLLAALVAGQPAAAESENELIARGKYLVHAADCVSCHSDPFKKIPPMAGGRALETPFGTFYTPNITPDLETGIGSWEESEFLAAMWSGLTPDRQNYYPAFPYPSYSGMSRDDVLAIRAYLFSLAPVYQPNREHELRWYLSGRMIVGLWKGLYYKRGRFEPDPDRSEQWNRGAYLVRHLGHCGECHTRRNAFGAPNRAREMAGSGPGPHGDAAPNITPDRDDGIGRWSGSELDLFLELGILPDGDFAGNGMSDVIENSTSHLTPEDRRAIAVYLRSLPPLPDQRSEQESD